MAPPLEIEIKLSMAGRWREALLNHPALQGPTHVRALHSIYYDTPGWRLRRAKASLRVRQSDGAIEQTFKCPADARFAIGRGECNCELASAALDLDAFPAPERARIAELGQGEPLQPYADVYVDRTIRMVSRGGARIEVALDSGEAVAGGCRRDFAELELELKQGQLPDLLSLALELPLGPDLLWSVTAKADRAWMLACGATPQATRAIEPALAPDMTVAQALQAVAWTCLFQLLHNYTVTIEASNEDALHQCRVALRRLRAAFAFFGAFLGDDASQTLKAELRAATNALGPARDLDVLIATVRARLKSDPEGRDQLLVQLAEQRTEVYRGVHDFLTSTSFQRLLFETALWIEQGTWRTLEAAERPALGFVEGELRRRRRRIRKTGKKLDTLTPGERHRLRIAIKKLRYAAEFCGRLFPEQKISGLQKAMVSRLGDLQDLLGDLNDIAVRQSQGISGLALVNDIERARLAMLLGEDDDEEEGLVQAASAAWEAAMEVRPFWKRPDCL